MHDKAHKYQIMYLSILLTVAICIHNKLTQSTFVTLYFMYQYPPRLRLTYITDMGVVHH